MVNHTVGTVDPDALAVNDVVAQDLISDIVCVRPVPGPMEIDTGMVPVKDTVLDDVIGRICQGQTSSTIALQPAGINDARISFDNLDSGIPPLLIWARIPSACYTKAPDSNCISGYHNDVT